MLIVYMGLGCTSFQVIGMYRRKKDDTERYAHHLLPVVATPSPLHLHFMLYIVLSHLYTR